MACITVDAWKCDICGYVWMKKPGVMPVQCAKSKCRSRIWNCEAGEAPAKTEIPKPQRVPQVESVRPIAVLSESATVENDGPMCTYTEYDGATGETYGCSLPAGHRFKHQRGRQL
jgi:hypothetical protein